MLQAAQLALDQPGAPALTPLDTAGVPAGARAAMRVALDGGAGLILGPLTTAETAAVAPVARAAGIPVLAFTSDQNQAQDGVWTLGVTPGQQVRRLVLAAQAEGRGKLAAVLPQNVLGDALSSGFTAAAQDASLPEPRIVRYAGSFARLDAGLQEVSDYAARRPAPVTPILSANGVTDPTPETTPPTPAPQPASDTPMAPPPFDTLLLGASGPLLLQAAPVLRTYGLQPSAGAAGVRILGPGVWSREAPRLSGLGGAWFAAPDPALRVPFNDAYVAKYGAPPRDLASLAYDAASVARVVADATGFSSASLMRPEGFAGADGVFALLPQGVVRRGLAIFEIDAKGAHIVQPAPQAMGVPGV